MKTFSLVLSYAIQRSHKNMAHFRLSKMKPRAAMANDPLLATLSDITLPAFRELLETSAASELLCKGRDAVTPLSLVGYFLRLQGNSLLRHL